VANAVGAIAGSVMVEEELLVYPQLSRDGLEVLGYYVQAYDERREFEELGDALANARALSRERAVGAAIRSGADNPQVTVEERTDGLDTYRIRPRPSATHADAVKRETMELERIDTKRAYERIASGSQPWSWLPDRSSTTGDWPMIWGWAWCRCVRRSSCSPTRIW